MTFKEQVLQIIKKHEKEYNPVDDYVTTDELAWLYEEIRSLDESSWYTGTPTENGTYVCRMKNDFAKWLVLNFKNGIWNVDGTSQSFADVGYNNCIEKWMKIAEEEET